MADIQNSALLTAIIECAENLRKQKECSGLTRDYIIVAAIKVLAGMASADHSSDEEFVETQKLLQHLTSEEDKLGSLLDKWEKKEIPMMERIRLSSMRRSALDVAAQSKKTELTAAIYLKEILKDETAGIKSLHKPGVQASTQTEKTEAQRSEEAAQQAEYREPASMGELVMKARELQTTLQDIVLGQQHAVSTFVSGYFQSELQAMIEKDRQRPRATFLFAGPPGVGKTFLSEESARILGLPFRRFDMSEYADANATDEFAGSDENYKGSSEGQVTGFVRKNPHCILLFDEIEKARIDVIHLFLQILDAGRIRDNRTDEEVSFKDAILIFTTNAGKELYEDDNTENLSSLSRDVILDALGKELSPLTHEPVFPAAICSRFASGNVVMFNHLDAYTLRLVVKKQMLKKIADLKAAMDITINMEESIPTALLLAEGAFTDARSAKSRADAFFGGELYELFRLLPLAQPGRDGGVRTINLRVNHDGESEKINALFAPSEKIHALAYSHDPIGIDTDDLSIPAFHYVRSADEAKAIIDTENIQLILCDLFSDEWTRGAHYLNLEDRHSEARNFLHAMLERYPGIPIVLLEPIGRAFTDEEKFSYLRKGVRGFLSMQPEGLAERLKQYTDTIFQQHSLSELARGNQLIRFETAQSVNEAGDTADIVIFDMRLEKAIKASDAGNILSLLSTPDVKFEDVIGADDAKQELQFFVNYMQNTKRLRKSGVAAPKGILLYGPPGTGKTMLAKAFAAESGAAFIASEGNQFMQKYIGEGKDLVHRLFAMARRYAPAVLFIDEIDMITRRRSGGSEGQEHALNETMTALLSEMDGFANNSDKPVFVLGATNYSVDGGSGMQLDPAALRRFDRRILIDLPNLENRKAFLERELKKKEIFAISEASIDSLAKRSTGMSLANLASVLDLAIRAAVRKGEEHVVDATLDEAFETFNGGESKKWSPENTLRTARHEAGHTLVSWLSGEKPSYVTIVSRGHFGGYMQHEDQEDRMGYTRRELIDKIRTALAGRAAEIVCYGKEEGISTGPSSDLLQATSMATQMLYRYGMDEQVGLAVVDPSNSAIAGEMQKNINALLKEQLDEAIRLITQHRAKLDRLVEELLARNSLNAEDIDKVLSDGV